MKAQAKLSVYSDNPDGTDWRWRINAADGTIMADSVTAYPTKTAANAALRATFKAVDSLREDPEPAKKAVAKKG